MSSRGLWSPGITQQCRPSSRRQRYDFSRRHVRHRPCITGKCCSLLRALLGQQQTEGWKVSRSQEERPRLGRWAEFSAVAQPPAQTSLGSHLAGGRISWLISYLDNDFLRIFYSYHLYEPHGKPGVASKSSGGAVRTCSEELSSRFSVQICSEWVAAITLHELRLTVT